MSLYHLSTSVGSRAGGQSASAKDDYIEREGRYEGDASELEHSESGHMPEWAEEDPHAYWEAADAHERANGRLFREVEFALPTELSGSERLEAAREFAHFLTDRERLPYTLAIHRGGGENPHCHLVISERSNDGLERTAETWFKRYNGKAPERGGCAEDARPPQRSGSRARGKRGPSMRTVPWPEPEARSGSTTGVCPIGRRKRGRRETWRGQAELSREPGRHLGPGAAIEAKFWQGQGESPSSALAEAGEVEERNDRMGESVGVGEPGVEPGARGARPDAGGLAGCGAGHPGDGQKDRGSGAAGCSIDRQTKERKLSPWSGLPAKLQSRSLRGRRTGRRPVGSFPRSLSGTGTCAGEVRHGQCAGQAEGAHGGVGGCGKSRPGDRESAGSGPDRSGSLAVDTICRQLNGARIEKRRQDRRAAEGCWVGSAIGAQLRPGWYWWGAVVVLGVLQVISGTAGFAVLWDLVQLGVLEGALMRLLIQMINRDRVGMAFATLRSGSGHPGADMASDAGVNFKSGLSVHVGAWAGGALPLWIQDRTGSGPAFEDEFRSRDLCSMSITPDEVEPPRDIIWKSAFA